jgi:hypothetical protein
MSEQDSTRRDLLKKAMYVSPAILTLVAIPSFASAGSSESTQRGAVEERHRADGFWEEVQHFFGTK